MKMTRDQILEKAEEIFFKVLSKKSFMKTNGGVWISSDANWAVSNDPVDGIGKDWSAGTIRISFKGKVVWWMSYAGWCKKPALPFLKKALLNAFKEKVFNGGRGNTLYQDPKYPDLAYRNHTASCRNSFSMFEGFDEILSVEDSNVVGFCKFMGMALI